MDWCAGPSAFDPDPAGPGDQALSVAPGSAASGALAAGVRAGRYALGRVRAICPAVSPPRTRLGWIRITHRQNSHVTLPSSSITVVLDLPQLRQCQVRLAVMVTRFLAGSRRRALTRWQEGPSEESGRTRISRRDRAARPHSRRAGGDRRAASTSAPRRRWRLARLSRGDSSVEVRAGHGVAALTVRTEQFAASFDELGAAVGTEALRMSAARRLGVLTCAPRGKSLLEPGAFSGVAHGAGVGVVGGAAALAAAGVPSTPRTSPAGVRRPGMGVVSGVGGAGSEASVSTPCSARWPRGQAVVTTNKTNSRLIQASRFIKAAILVDSFCRSSSVTADRDWLPRPGPFA